MGCGDVLAEAGSVIEAVSSALSPGTPGLRSMREQCLPAKLSVPQVPPCLPCTPEEAMAMTQAALARLRGAGSALGLVLRFDSSDPFHGTPNAFEESAGGTSEVVVGTIGPEMRKDFFILVPVIEMALSNLRRLTKLIFQQLECDLAHVPANTGKGGIFADPSMKSLVGSLSMISAWEHQEAQQDTEQDEEADPVTSPSEPVESFEVEGSVSMKANRKSVRKKTSTAPKGKKKS